MYTNTRNFLDVNEICIPYTHSEQQKMKYKKINNHLENYVQVCVYEQWLVVIDFSCGSGVVKGNAPYIMLLPTYTSSRESNRKMKQSK